MKITAVLSTMWLAMSVAFSGGLSNVECAAQSGRFAACHAVAPVADATPASASSVADQFVVLSFI